MTMTMQPVLERMHSSLGTAFDAILSE
jgi:hypothetical protein